MSIDEYKIIEQETLKPNTRVNGKITIADVAVIYKYVSLLSKVDENDNLLYYFMFSNKDMNGAIKIKMNGYGKYIFKMPKDWRVIDIEERFSLYPIEEIDEYEAVVYRIE